MERIKRDRAIAGLRKRRSPEGGYILLVILLFLALLIIAMTAVAPRLVHEIQRQREEELIHRGTQYAVAIKKFYRQFGRYPNTLDELENSNRMRFLRKRYEDPMSDSGEWRIIRMGEQRSRPGPAAPGQVGTPAAALGSGQPAGSQANQPKPLAGGQTETSGGSGGQRFGGAPIVGVASTSKKLSIREIDGKNHYNEWEFVYDPRFDLSLQQAGAPAQGGQGAARGKPQPAGAQQQPQPQAQPQQQPTASPLSQ